MICGRMLAQAVLLGRIRDQFTVHWATVLTIYNFKTFLSQLLQFFLEAKAFAASWRDDQVSLRSCASFTSDCRSWSKSSIFPGKRNGSTMIKGAKCNFEERITL